MNQTLEQIYRHLGSSQSHASDRKLGKFCASPFFGLSFQHRSLDRAGSDGIDEYTASRDLARQGLGECNDSTLARRVVNDLNATDLPELRGDVDDPPAASR